VADALGVPLAEGKARWDQAQARLKRQQQQLPPTTRTKPPGARQPTPTLAADAAAKALALVLKEPLKEFFDKEEKLAWLREKVQEAGGDPKTVDAEVQQLLAEKAQREADALSLVLPGLQAGGTAMALRTAREDDEVMGSVFDYLRWLGVEDAKHEWHNWLREAFRTELDSGRIIRYVEKVFPGQHTATPSTNFAGFRLLTKLCLHKSTIAKGMYDQALVLLGQVSVGDQRLHGVLDANAANSSRVARAFVLGSQEANAQKLVLEEDELEPEVAGRHLANGPVAMERISSRAGRSRSPRGGGASSQGQPRPLPLPEACLDWLKDFKVSRQELVGVKSQFKAIVQVEISAGKLPQRAPVETWAKAPPLRLRDLAQGAVASYRSLLERRYGPIAVGSPPMTDDRKRSRVCSRSSDESSGEDDEVLKISEVMRAAGVWKAVWSSFRSDLANQMLALKCAETDGSFSARRAETVRGGVHVLVHKYKKSSDWPLAWRALLNTRDVYEKRVREFLEDMFRVARHPEETICQSSARLAGEIAATLRVTAA
jgi:hypothetical protein